MGVISMENMSDKQAQHTIPKCMSCGTITEWKVEPIFIPKHLIIGFILLFFFGAGFFYLLVLGLLRSNQNNRAKICPKCGARNLWSFIY